MDNLCEVFGCSVDTDFISAVDFQNIFIDKELFPIVLLIFCFSFL